MQKYELFQPFTTKIYITTYWICNITKWINENPKQNYMFNLKKSFWLVSTYWNVNVQQLNWVVQDLTMWHLFKCLNCIKTKTMLFWLKIFNFASKATWPTFRWQTWLLANLLFSVFNVKLHLIQYFWHLQDYTRVHVLKHFSNTVL